MHQERVPGPMMMLLRRVSLIVAIGSGLFSSAQEGTPERKADFKLMLTLDFRRTWVDGDPLGFHGMRIGAQKDRHIIALGVYGIGIPVLKAYVQQRRELPGLGDREVRTKFDFITLTYERIVFENKKWQLGIPFGVGLGNYRIRYQDDDGSFKAYSTNELVPADLSLYANYKFTWWGFFGAGGGYRYVHARDREIIHNLSNWTWFVKAGLRFGQIYKRIKGIEDGPDGH